MQKRIARVGDTASGTCNAHSGTVSWTAIFSVGTSGITVEGQQAVTVDDINNTSCGHHFKVVGGSSVLKGNGKAVAREGDACVVLEGGSGIVTSGANFITSE